MPRSEENIDYLIVGNEKIELKEEYPNEQIGENQGEKILFTKYFNDGKDLNKINYENNNSNTTQKMDIEQSMPLKKFTLRLYLIYRWNNFEPMDIRTKTNDDVVKMQILFERIKGDEKENKYIVEAENEPQRVIMDFDDSESEDEEEEGEKKEEPFDPELQPRNLKSAEAEENLHVKTPEIEAFEGEPPMKRIYLGDEDEDNSENENELY